MQKLGSITEEDDEDVELLSKMVEEDSEHEFKDTREQEEIDKH